VKAISCIGLQFVRPARFGGTRTTEGGYVLGQAAFSLVRHKAPRIHGELLMLGFDVSERTNRISELSRD
jgi:hypothetical protein